MKPVIVLLPGFDGNGSVSFAKLSAELKKHFDVLVIDYPYGPGAGSYSLDGLTKFVHDRVEERTKNKVMIMGFSMGGFIATRYLELYPEKVSELYLVGAALRPYRSVMSRLLLRVILPLLLIRNVGRLIGQVYYSAWFAMVKKVFNLPPSRAVFDKDAGLSVFGTLARIAVDIGGKEYTAGLKRLKTKKRALLFMDDINFPAERYKEQMRKYGFDLTLVRSGGHATSRDYWEKVAKFISTGK